MSAERKAELDALLLALPGVSARTIRNLHAYFVADKMFACVGDRGLGLRLPAAMATELQFSREGVSSFAPGGLAATREWIQVERADPADHAQDLELVRAAIDFARQGRR